MNELSFNVPLVPLSVNHYVKHTRTGRRYVTGEASAFKQAIAIFSRGEYVAGKAFSVALTIVLAAGDRGDIDNFPKLILDGMADCGVFRDKKLKPLSDGHVDHMEITRDRTTRPEQGWTQITVRAMA